MAEFYGGAPNAFAGGRVFAGDMRRRRQQENALSALIDRFGPEAADPGALATLESVQQNRQLFPIQLEDAQRVGAARAAAVGAVGPLAGDPTALATVNGQRDRERALRQQAGLNAATYVQNVVRRGGDVAAAFDRIGSILPQLGYDPAQIPAIREQLVGDPAFAGDLVAALRSGDPNSVVRAIGQPVPVYDAQGRPRLLQNYTDGSSEIIEGVTPANTLLAEGRLSQGDARLGLTARSLSLEEARMRGFDAPPGTQLYEQPDGTIVARMIEGTPQALEQDKALTERAAALRSSAAGLTAANDIASAGIEAIDDALALMNEIGAGPLSTMFRLGQARIPGTQAAYLAERIKDVADRNMLEALQNVEGTLTPVSDTDAAALRSAYGALSISQDPAVLERNLRRIREIYARAAARSVENRTRAQTELERAQATRDNLTRAPVSEPSLEDLVDFYTR